LSAPQNGIGRKKVSLPKEALMYRTIVIATITLGAVSLAVEPSQASGQVSGHGGTPATAVASNAPHTPPNLSGGAATPQVKKLSPKAASACYRACMHGMDSSMENFCGVSCF
jgi:hypothetical protein